MGAPGPALPPPPPLSSSASPPDLLLSASTPCLVPASRKERAEKRLKPLSPPLFPWPSPCWDHPGETTNHPLVCWLWGSVSLCTLGGFPEALLALCPFFSPPHEPGGCTLAGVGTCGGQGTAGSRHPDPPDPSSARGGSQPFTPHLNDLPVIPPRSTAAPFTGADLEGGHRLPAVTPLPPPARPWGPAGEGLSRTKLREDFVANKSRIELPVLESLPSVVRARAGGSCGGAEAGGRLVGGESGA